jgi:hypothetical protein
MCRPIGVAESLLRKTCKQLNICSYGDAGAKALAFLCGRTTDMAKKPGTRPKNEFVFFDVVYEDGSQRSNRRVPTELLGGPAKDEPARGFIIEQDRGIAEKSGRLPLPIKSIGRAGARNK